MKKTIVSLALVLAIGAIWFFHHRSPIKVSYREVPVQRSDLHLVIQSTGTVQPENRLEIKPPIAGRIEEVKTDEGKQVRKGEILAWMSSTERAALLDAARAKGADEVKKWEELYKATPILAPIRGTIIKRNVETGQTFTSSDSVFVMSDRLTVKAQVDETDIAQIQLKQRATILLDAYPSQPIEATVDQIAYDSTTVNNVTTYSVDVLPKLTPEFMRSGMTANVAFDIASKKGVLVIPNQAYKVKTKKVFALLKPTNPNLEPQEHEIQIGLSDGKRTEVTEGLKENEVVLVAEIGSSMGNSSQAQNPLTPNRGVPRNRPRSP